jgi:hypothetical protein
MKKMCVMLVIGISVGLFGCKKAPPAAPKAPKPAVTQTQPAAEKAAAPIQQTAADAQKATQENAKKAAESAKPAAEQVKQTLTAIDLTSPLDTLKEQAAKMSVDALKATAEKYKTQFLSTKSDITNKTDQMSKISPGAEVLALSKDIQILTNSLAPLKERMMVYVDALKAQGVDVNSFTL